MEKVLTGPLATELRAGIEEYERDPVPHLDHGDLADYLASRVAALATADEARGLDVDRLSRAIGELTERIGIEFWREPITGTASLIAAEYARLAAHPDTGDAAEPGLRAAASRSLRYGDQIVRATDAAEGET